MKLSSSDESHVNEAMANTDDGAGLSFREYVQYCMDRDIQNAVKNKRSRYPKLTDQELEWKVRFEKLSDWPNGWYLRGIARRLATGSLDEFGQFMLMHVRQSVLNHATDDDEFTSIWPLLCALAIGDQTAIDQYVAISTFPLEEGNPDTQLIYNCVHCLLRSSMKELKSHLKGQATKKRPAWLAGIVVCLDGIAANNPEQVAAGLEQHLDGFKKSSKVDPLEKIISLEAHGLLRLAERIDPDLVARFDTSRKLPWDQEFHDWSLSHQPALKTSDFAKCPKPLAEAFVKLKRPSCIEETP